MHSPKTICNCDIYPFCGDSRRHPLYNDSTRINKKEKALESAIKLTRNNRTDLALMMNMLGSYLTQSYFFLMELMY